jgi:hypothetical protein
MRGGVNRSLNANALEDNKEIDSFKKQMALIRFHYKIDPASLTVDDFGKLWGELYWVLKYYK